MLRHLLNRSSAISRACFPPLPLFVRKFSGHAGLQRPPSILHMLTTPMTIPPKSSLIRQKEPRPTKPTWRARQRQQQQQQQLEMSKAKKLVMFTFGSCFVSFQTTFYVRFLFSGFSDT